MSNAKGAKGESCSRVKDENGRLAQGEDEAKKAWEEYVCLKWLVQVKVYSFLC